MSPKLVDDDLKARALVLAAQFGAREAARRIAEEFRGRSVTHGTIAQWAHDAGVVLGGTTGRRLGDYTSTKRDDARRLVAEGKKSKAAIARQLKISRQQLYNLLED